MVNIQQVKLISLINVHIVLIIVRDVEIIKSVMNVIKTILVIQINNV